MNAELQQIIGSMTEKQKFQLNEMIAQYNPVDQTELIRQLKHSAIMRQEVQLLTSIQRDFFHEDLQDPTHSIIRMKIQEQCPLLNTYFGGVVTKMLTGEFDVTILYRLIDVLGEIEKGTINQHEASFLVGTILKNIYCAATAEPATPPSTPLPPVDDSTAIDWKTFKKLKQQQQREAAASLS